MSKPLALLSVTTEFGDWRHSRVVSQKSITVRNPLDVEHLDIELVGSFGVRSPKSITP